MSLSRLPILIGRLYEIVDELEKTFLGRKFTPDGHLVGSIGEAVAQHLYGLELAPPSCKDFDALTIEGQKVQIKASAGTRIQISASEGYAELLIVLHIDRMSGFDEVYAGHFPYDLLKNATVSSRGYMSCSLKALRNKRVHELPHQIDVAELNRGFRSGIS